MSSMLKKSGGLSFKPKAGRRPAAAPAASASTTATPAQPPTESSQDAPQQATPSSTAPEPQTSASRPVAAATEDTSSQQDNNVPVAASPSLPSPDAIAAPLPTPESTQTASASQPSQQKKPSHPLPDASSTVSNATPQKKSVAQEPQARANASASAPNIRSAGTRQPRRVMARSSGSDTVTNTASAPSTSAAAIPANESGSTPATSTAEAAPTPEELTTSAPAPKKKRQYKKRQPPTTDGEAEGEQSSAAPKRKRINKKRQASAGQDNETPGTGAAAADASTHQPKEPNKRRRREPTPEDAENVEVDHTKMKVGEMTKDLRIGKPFKHAEAIAERAREARANAKLRKLEKQKRALGLLPPEEDESSQPGTPANKGRSRAGSAAIDSGLMRGADAGPGVGYEVVDGQIIVNQQSLVVDRHAEHDAMNLVTVEEDDFTHLTTSATFMRPSRAMGPNVWSDDDTEKFYKYLGMFGTDFETISHMFPGRSRRHVKCKFNREERLRPKRVNAAIMVRGVKQVDIDIDEYKGSRSDWQDSEDIKAAHDRLVEEHRQDVERLREERVAAGMIDDDHPGAGPGRRENVDDEQGSQQAEQDGGADGEGAEETEHGEDAPAIVETAVA